MFRHCKTTLLKFEHGMQRECTPLSPQMEQFADPAQAYLPGCHLALHCKWSLAQVVNAYRSAGQHSERALWSNEILLSTPSKDMVCNSLLLQHVRRPDNFKSISATQAQCAS
jgi:hypothetical protein